MIPDCDVDCDDDFYDDCDDNCEDDCDDECDDDRDNDLDDDCDNDRDDDDGSIADLGVLLVLPFMPLHNAPPDLDWRHLDLNDISNRSENLKI